MNKVILMDKFGKRLNPEEAKGGTPVLKLKCIESYSNPNSNRELFTKNYVYHVFMVHKDKLEMQTNFSFETAEVPNEIAKQIFAGFGKQNKDAIKSI